MKRKLLLLPLLLLTLTGCNNNTKTWLAVNRPGTSNCRHILITSYSIKDGTISAKSAFGEIKISNASYCVFTDSSGSCPLCGNADKRSWIY